MTNITRREFITLSAAAAAGMAMSGGCMSLTSRYAAPGGLTRREEKLLLVNGNFIDVREGKVRDGRELLIMDGRIAAIGDGLRGKGMTPDRTLDLKGAYVSPGLINAHCHITMPGGLSFNLSFIQGLERQSERNAEECVKHGVTTVRDCLAAASYLTKLVDRIAKNKVVGPRIVGTCALQVKGGYLRQIGWITPSRYWKNVKGPAQAREAVKKAVDTGAGFIKVFQQPVEMYLPGKQIPVMDLPTLAAVCDEAAKAGKTVAMHHVGIDGFRTGADAGVHSFEHLVCDRELTDEDIKKFTAAGAWSVPTISVAYALAFEKRNDLNWGKGRTLQIAELRSGLMEGMMKEFLEPGMAKLTYESFRKCLLPKTFDKPPGMLWPDPAIPTAAAVRGEANLMKLRAAGANFGCGNDGGIPFAFPGAMALELQLHETVGFTPAEGLRFATINNARLLGMESLIGSIEEKKAADLVVTAKNPLEGARNLFNPDMVFIDGQLRFRKEGLS